MTKTDKKGHTERHDPHWVEWLTGIASAIIVAGLMGWLVYEAVTRSGEPPALSIVAGEIGRADQGFTVTFEIRNSAPTTAAAVMVAGEIRDNGRVIERAEVTFDYVPAESKADGALIFENDPNGRELVIRPTGFTDP